MLCFLLPLLSFGQQFTVSGTVTDKNTGEPLPGATVLIYKTHKGCSADFDGNYVLKAALNDTLQFSFVGMKTQKRIVTQEELHVQLEEDDQINLEFDRPYIPTQPRHTPSVRVITAKELEQSLKKSNHLSDTLVLFGVVKDAYELLPFAKIELKVNKLQTYSDFDGNFLFSIANYKKLKFPDTLQISYTGFKTYEALLNSIEELKMVFSISNNALESYPTFVLEAPSDGYIEVVPYRKHKKLRLKKNRN